MAEPLSVSWAGVRRAGAKSMAVVTGADMASISEADLAAALALAVWIYLIVGHGRFWRWRAEPVADELPAGLDTLPEIVAIIPARNEADGIGTAVTSLLTQDYPRPVSVIVVDDQSTDGTAELARQAAEAIGAGDRLIVRAGQNLPPGWTGKLWAVAQGVDLAGEKFPDAQYWLLTDGDIHHDFANLRELATRAETAGLDLASLMVRLRIDSFWDRLLIPAFVFFFQMLYPFSRVADPRRREAAAAGGCMLVRRRALEAAGGIGAIRDRLIDDCALAALLKRRGGAIWLGLSDRTYSLRRYRGLRDIWDMVARTAYTQLRYSPWLVAGTVLAMGMAYLVPPLALAVGLWRGEMLTAALGGAGWLLMAVAYLPTVGRYRLSPPVALSLPVAGVFYALMTLSSAWRHYRGAGGAWKGRHYDGPRGSRPAAALSDEDTPSS